MPSLNCLQQGILSRSQTKMRLSTNYGFEMLPVIQHQRRE